MSRAINNTWGAGGPSGVGVGTDNFSVRWSQTFTGLAAGPYTLTTTSDDGIRVSVDGVTAPYVINDWTDHGATTDTATVQLAAGTHTVVVEYYEHTGDATAVFTMAAPPTSCPSGQWLASVFQQHDVDGARRWGCGASRAINNTWGVGGPSGVGVGTDNFSVRWSQTFTGLAAGPYTLTTTSDDGIRVSVDGVTTPYVINDWTDHGATTDTATVQLAAGTHTVVVEYYEHTGDATAVFTMTGP